MCEAAPAAPEAVPQMEYAPMDSARAAVLGSEGSPARCQVCFCRLGL